MIMFRLYTSILVKNLILYTTVVDFFFFKMFLLAILNLQVIWIKQCHDKIYSNFFKEESLLTKPIVKETFFWKKDDTFRTSYIKKTVLGQCIYACFFLYDCFFLHLAFSKILTLYFQFWNMYFQSEYATE